MSCIICGEMERELFLTEEFTCEECDHIDVGKYIENLKIDLEFAENNINNILKKLLQELEEFEKVVEVKVIKQKIQDKMVKGEILC